MKIILITLGLLVLTSCNIPIVPFIYTYKLYVFLIFDMLILNERINTQLHNWENYEKHI
jgi:hypothetical protein